MSLISEALVFIFVGIGVGFLLVCLTFIGYGVLHLVLH